MSKLSSRLARGALWFVAPLSLSLLAVPAQAAGDRQAGLEKTAACVACHGHDGVSRRPDVPNIAGHPALYISQQLRAYRSGERSHPNMTVVAQSLSDEDIANLAAWYSELEVTVECPECP